MNKIADLEVGIVPHREWALRQWFYANPLWYYHRPTDNHQLDTNPRFYELVDPDLRPLCKLLNDHQILTTPSCQGHFYPRQRFEDIWHELRLESVRIRDHGLAVKDAENGDAGLFSNPDYRLPWENFEAFYRQAGPHQNTGFLGFILPRDRAALADRLREKTRISPEATIEADQVLSTRFGGPSFCVRVQAHSEQEQSKVWAEVTACVTRIIADSD